MLHKQCATGGASNNERCLVLGRNNYCKNILNLQKSCMTDIGFREMLIKFYRRYFQVRFRMLN